MTDIDPADYSVSDLEDALSSVDDVGVLEAVLQAEQEGKDRKTAKGVIERRLEEVAGGGAATGGGDEAPEAMADGEGASGSDPTAAVAGAVDTAGESLGRFRAGTTAAAPSLVGRSAALERLFGRETDAPLWDAPGFVGYVAVLALVSLWQAVGPGAGSSLSRGPVIVLAVLVAGALLVLFAWGLADLEQTWLPATATFVAYAVLAGVLVLLNAAIAGGGAGAPAPLGLLAAAVPLVALQGATLGLLVEAGARPLSAGTDGDASLHLANWWRATGVALALLLLGLLTGSPAGASGIPSAGAIVAFVPPGLAVGTLVLYVLRKSALAEGAA